MSHQNNKDDESMRKTVEYLRLVRATQSVGSKKVKPGGRMSVSLIPWIMGIGCLVGFVQIAVYAASDANASIEQTIAVWVPPSVLVLIAIFFGGAYGRTVLGRLTGVEMKLMTIIERMPSFVTIAQVEAMREQTRNSMGSMGDRFDSRVMNVSERLAAAEAILKNMRGNDR